MSAAEAAEFEAISAQIIPSGASPGATAAGVVYFIDTALAGLRSEALEPMRQGLEDLQADVQNTYQVKSFAGLNHDQQIAVLQGIEDTPFFSSIRFLTLAFRSAEFIANAGRCG